jgi:hypothetical protein
MKKCNILTVALAALLAAAVYANQEKLASSIKEARAETSRTSEQLKSTLSALNGLTKQKKGDLRPAYETFCSEISKTEAAANWTKMRINWMTGDGQTYFSNWQKTVDGISNEKLRKKTQNRLDSVQESYKKVETSLQVAGDKFVPFLSDLNDIKKALGADITQGGVKALKSTVRSANWNHQFLDQSIDSALKEMDKMEKALSSEVKE